MESICLICGSKTNILEDKKIKVTYDVCPNCDFISKKTVYHLDPADEKKRYDTHNNSDIDSWYAQNFRNMIKLHIRPLKNVRNILDFGSGPYPMLKNLLVEEGYHVRDFDAFYNTNNEFLEYKYDLITTTEAIEHFTNPLLELYKMKDLIVDNGYLLIMTRFRDMDITKFLDWGYRRDQTHISFFNLNTFNYIADMLQFRIIEHNSKDIIVLQKK